MTLSKEKLGDCPPPQLHSPPSHPPPPPHPDHTMAPSHHQPLYHHRLRLQQQSTEDDKGMEMTFTGRSYKATAATEGGGGVPSAASLIHRHHHHHNRPPWHIKDEVLPQIHNNYDVFEEWPNGNVQKAYSSSCPEAKGHQSGWAMRNTNNHDPKRLKKSCLGVMMCNRKCINEDGFMVHIRPYICDKARRKQEGTRCPTKGCEGHLFQMKCSGHSTKPVTHIWRTEGSTIFFQAKGDHGHLAPEPKMSVNTRRLVESRNRPSLHNATIRRTSKTRLNKKTNRVNHPTSQMTFPWYPRDVTSVPLDVFTMSSHPVDYPQDMALLALQQQQPQQQLLQTTGTSRSSIGPLTASSGHLPSTSIAVTAQFIELDDLSHPSPTPLPPFLPSFRSAEHEMVPPGTNCPSSMNGTATCMNSYFFDEVCASMTYNAGPGCALLQDPPPSFKDYAMVHGIPQTPHAPSAFCLPSSQSTFPFYDQGHFTLSDGSFRCTTGGSVESEEDIRGGGRLEGSPAGAEGALGLIGTATTGFDGYLLSELAQARQYQARWMSSSPIDRSPNHSPSMLLSNQFPPPYQYRSQFDLQDSQHQRTSKANIGQHRTFLQQQQQQQPSNHLHLSPSFDHHQTQHQHQQRAIAGIVGLGTTSAAATAAVYFNNDYLANSAIVRL